MSYMEGLGVTYLSIPAFTHFIHSLINKCPSGTRNTTKSKRDKGHTYWGAHLMETGGDDRYTVTIITNCSKLP